MNLNVWWPGHPQPNGEREHDAIRVYVNRHMLDDRIKIWFVRRPVEGSLRAVIRESSVINGSPLKDLLTGVARQEIENWQSPLTLLRLYADSTAMECLDEHGLRYDDPHLWWHLLRNATWPARLDRGRELEWFFEHRMQPKVARPRSRPRFTLKKDGKDDQQDRRRVILRE